VTANDPLSERDLIALVEAGNWKLPAHVLIAPGDDMAMLAVPGSAILVAVDQVVQGRHFVDATPLDLVARKAVARNVSDVAAMAAIPLATLAAVVLPRSIGLDGARELLDSVRKYAAEFKCPLIGGDTAVHQQSDGPLVLSVTILATPRADGLVVTRDGAQIGDRLIVSGPLGGSFGDSGQGRHLTFTPRIAEAHAIADRIGVALHAMIDISDGLGLDCARLIDASTRKCQRMMQARLDSQLIPCNAGMLIRHALGDGEDYELLAAIDWSVAIPDRWIEIGSIIDRPTNDPRSVVVRIGESDEDATNLGWNHD